MRRLLLAVAVGTVAAAAVLVPRPPEPEEPLAGVVLDRPGLSSPADAAIWYCAWAQAGSVRDSYLAIASTADSLASFTFPVAIPGEPADTATLETSGPGAAALDLSDVARRGDSPFFVEFDAGPAAVSATVHGEGVLGADACVSAGPEVWHFPGGSTIQDEILRLRIFNPFSETAKVTVTAVSEIGVEALGEYRGISVGPRSWRDIDFEEELRQRESLVISVVADEGLVVPVMRFGNGIDEDWWPGEGLSETWEFPIARLDGLDGELVMSNPGLEAVEVTVDVLTLDGARSAVTGITLEPETPVRLALTGLEGEAAGARLLATGPITAAVVAGGDLGLAVMPGAPEQARTWLVPGLHSTGLESGTLWVMNTSDESIAVTVSALGGGEVLAEQVVVDAASIYRVDVTGEDVAGYLVQGSEPMTVAWSVVGPSGAAFAAASPVLDG